jgi:hypothetical protein
MTPACKRLSSSTGGICFPGVNKGIGQQISTPATKMESTVRELQRAAQWAEIPKTWSQRLFADYSRCE